MTSAEAPAPRRGAALARGWRDFRRWRRGRPFWGGLFLILAGLEILASGGLSLGNLQLRVGLTGFQYYIIPAILILCGLLSWLTPAQRIFYGILGALVAVYSLIGVNFGGWFIGMLLGVIGGSLSAAWTPVVPVEPASTPDQSDETEESDVDDSPAGDADTTVDELMTGPLTDVLPQSTTPPIPLPRAPQRSVSPDDVPPAQGGSLPRRSPPLLAITLVPLILAAMTLAAVPGPQPAYADRCPAPKPPTTAPTTAPKPPNPPAPPTATTAPTSPTPQPSPSPSTQQGNPIGNFIGGVLDAIGGLLGFGGGRSAGTPTPTTAPAVPGGQPAPATPPAPAPGGQPAPGGKPAPGRPAPPKVPTTSCGPTAAPTKARTLAADVDQPPVAARPGKLTGDSVTMFGLVFDGVVELKRADGSTVRALRFLMSSSTVTDFKLVTVDSSGKRITITSPALTVEGNVKFYASRFSGKLFGIELVLTPDPPIPSLPIPPLPFPITFTDPDVDLVFVDCDRLTGRPVLNIKAA